MKVRELIARLEKMNQEAVVVMAADQDLVTGVETGLMGFTEVKEVEETVWIECGRSALGFNDVVGKRLSLARISEGKDAVVLWDF